MKNLIIKIRDNKLNEIIDQHELPIPLTLALIPIKKTRKTLIIEMRDVTDVQENAA